MSNSQNQSKLEFNYGTKTIECNNSCEALADRFERAFKGCIVYSNTTAITSLKNYHNFINLYTSSVPNKQYSTPTHTFKLFNMKTYSTDIVDIEIDSTTINEEDQISMLKKLGGPPVDNAKVILPKCSYHWQLAFGAFSPKSNAADISPIPDKLSGYVTLIRYGNSIHFFHERFSGDFTTIHQRELCVHIFNWLTDRSNIFAKGAKIIISNKNAPLGDFLMQFAVNQNKNAFSTMASREASLAINAIDESGIIL